MIEGCDRGAYPFCGMSRPPGRTIFQEMATAAETTERAPPALPPVAWAYLVAIYAAAAAAAVAGLPVTLSEGDWPLVVVLGVLAAVAHLFVVVTPRNQSYHVSPGIVVAAAILLPPPLVALIVVVQHLPEWAKERYPWFIQVFNMANYALGAIAAGAVFDAINGVSGRSGAAELQFFVAGLAAALVFVAVHHTLLALALVTARGQRFFETGLFTFHSLSMEIGLAVLGVVVAALWDLNPFLIVLALAPLLLLHRMLVLPKLEAEARQDPKTGLYNARFFSDALEEAVERLDRGGPGFSLLLADLDLLREINNGFGHLAGDAVLAGVAKVLRDTIRPHDIAARFGGEEFCVLLPDTGVDEARAVAERIREAVERARIEVDTANAPIGVTISIGVAGAPDDAVTARDIMHLADVAAYRAKSEGRNRTAAARDATGSISGLARPEIPAAASGSGADSTETATADPTGIAVGSPNLHLLEAGDRPSGVPPAPNNLALRPAVRTVAFALAAVGALAGALGYLAPMGADSVALVILIGVVAVGQALAVGVLDHGSISVSAVGSLAGAALIGPRAALPLAVAVCAVEWAVQRSPFHKLSFNCGALTLSALAAAAVFAILPEEHWLFVAGGAVAGAVYYAVNVGLLAKAIALETRESWKSVLKGRFAWLFVYYVVYGSVGAMVAIGYYAAGPLGLLVFVLPVVLVRKAQLDYIAHTEASVRQLRGASQTIERQNESLTEANALLRERATEAMESLAAAVDARDAYTAGHSRRVQVLSVAIAHELSLSDEAVSSISFGALFHDVGKLAVPDAVLLKDGKLEEAEWELVRNHPVEGERIIGHLGFLIESTPAIRHHHEWFDGSGYPDGRRGEDIPLSARIVHVSDALDSMISSRTYRDAVGVTQAFEELRKGAGTQFCPQCVAAAERSLATGQLDDVLGLGAAA